MFCLVDFLVRASKDADKQLLSSFRLASLASEWLICLRNSRRSSLPNDSCLPSERSATSAGRHQNRKITPEFNELILSTNLSSLNWKHIILSVFSETEKPKKRRADKQIWCHQAELRPSEQQRLSVCSVGFPLWTQPGGKPLAAVLLHE